MNIPFPGDSFEMLIANHVLEHVGNDAVALAEIHRVLKPGGYAILQTPFSTKLQHTWEDPGISEDDMRLQAYGQADHVRLYGLDMIGRFAAAGLISQVCGHARMLADFDPVMLGVNAEEPFLLFRASK